MIGRGWIEQEHRIQSGRGVGLETQAQIGPGAIQRSEGDRVRRRPPGSTVLNIDAVTVGDEVVLSFLHAHHFGLIARRVAPQAFDVHGEFAAGDGLRQEILHVALAGVQLHAFARDERGRAHELTDGFAVN